MINQTIAEEAGLDSSWEPVERAPIVPGRLTGAPPAPNAMGPYFSGSVPPVLQHDTTFVGTAYGTPSIPSYALVPPGVSGLPSANSSTQSTIFNTVVEPTAPTVPNPPNYSIQIDNFGAFGSNQNFQYNPTIGVVSLKGILDFFGITSGNASIGVAAVAGTPNQINLPISTGSAGQFLKTDGGSPQQTSWATPSGINFQNPITLSGTVDGTNVTFTFPSAPSANYLITVGGSLLTPSVDYSVTGSTVTFTNAPLSTPTAYEA